MNSHSWHIAMAPAAIFVGACLGATPERSAQEARRAIEALIDSMATSISNRDADAIAAHMPSDSSVVYVSDGNPIRGTDLRKVLHTFYSQLQALSFRWDSVQAVPLTNQTWDATAWARIAVTDSLGHVTNSRAIFTWTIVRRDERWVLALAHKATLQ